MVVPGPVLVSSSFSSVVSMVSALLAGEYHATVLDSARPTPVG